MSGPGYSVPNVKWNTYFDGGIAFHTAYWHNNFGQPMSHGCVNMREADAKTVYDFLPLGTLVHVHN
jgi:lipoprotein-anchoring transpeptidase ErfK/SrfK